MPYIYYDIQNSDSFCIKWGSIYCNLYNNLKYTISVNSKIPYNEIIGLYDINGFKYNETDFNKGNKVIAKISSSYSYFYGISSLENSYSSLKSQYNTLQSSNSQLSNDLSSVRSNYYNLQSQYNSLQNLNDSNKRQITQLQSQNTANESKINNLIANNDNLNKELQKEKEIREQKEKNFQNLKSAFEKSQQLIENENVKESKKYIEKFISNVFLKEFEVDKEKKSEFKQSLTSHMKEFTTEFMIYSTKFINDFKANSQCIIKKFNIKENNPIEHINFIVIGKAGVGKSSFINESLLLSENKRAKEGDGVSVTQESILYSSEKLKMVRMWDTQGLDYQVTQEKILDEVKRIVEDGLKKGPDHYINIILYCTSGNRFQEDDGKLIYKIMSLYPSDNLPVIITQLQAYFKSQSKKMEETIRKVLDNYLDHKIVQKIEIRSIVSRDFIDEDTKTIYKANGIPELLRLSFDIMGRAISSATCKKLSQDIECLCKDYVDKKILYIHNIFKYEMEIIESSKNLFVQDLEDEEDFFANKKKKIQKKELSELNMYRKMEKPTYFVDNFLKIMRNKFIDIYNNLNNENIPIEEMEIDNQNNISENKDQNNSEQNDDLKENAQKENKIIENNQQKNNEETKNEENEEKKKENNEEEKKENNEEMKKQEETDKNEIKEDKPLVLFFIEDRLKNLEKKINDASNKTFEKIFKKRYQSYLVDLQREQSIKNKEFNDNSQIIDVNEVEKNFREKLFTYYKNEFFKIFFCIILKLFMNNLKDILISNYQKELKENEFVQKIINQKAENSLKSITEKLKQNLILELDSFMKEKQEINKKINAKKNEFDDLDVDFSI